MVSNAILIANGKGGVGKTSIAANVAGTAARGGWRVLAVDLDPQGNLGSDLGYKQRGVGDDGASLRDAVVSGGDVTVLRSVRPRLDVVAGGHHLRDLADRLTVRRLSDPSSLGALGRVLAPVASGYDLVVMDGPPAGGSLVDAGLAATRWVIIPVRGDEGSLDGLELIARSFASIRDLNPAVALMGIAIFDISVTATALRDELRTLLERELGDTAPVFRSVIRRSERSAFDMRRFGMLAVEYHERATEALSGDGIRRRIEAGRLGEAVERFSSAAGGLAEDYHRLSTEILERFTEAKP